MMSLQKNLLYPQHLLHINLNQLLLFFCFTGMFFASLVPQSLAASDCTLTAPESSLNRITTLSVNCPGASQFRLSEDPDFHQSPPRISINIDSVAPDNSYADLSITYPNGSNTPQYTPFYISPQTKQVRVLAIRYLFEDDSGKTSGMPEYATDTWLQHLVFSLDQSFDGQPGSNSIKTHLLQNSYGQVEIVGETYPQTVHLPIKYFFDPFDLYPNQNIADALISQIQSQNPNFLQNKDFDIILGFSPDHYSVQGALESLSADFTSTLTSANSFITTTIPHTDNSILSSTITNEPHISQTSTTVATNYDFSSVTGVWLASDPDHTGSNYFTGGSTIGTRGHRYIQLGQPLPQNNQPVIITYTPSATHHIDIAKSSQFPPDTLIYPDVWYARYIHELYHAISNTVTFSAKHFGDLYKIPGRLEKYDVMDNGFNYTDLLLAGDTSPRKYYEPSHLSGYNKIFAQFVFPHTLTFNHNQTSIRLYKSEESDYQYSTQRTKLIKVPLSPTAEPGFIRMNSTSPTQYSGEEYLLLEWRYKGSLQNNQRNFDAPLPSQGLMITHVLHQPANHGTETNGFGFNIAQIIDATPDQSLGNTYSDTPQSPALFGPDSGIYTFTMPDPWQETITDTFNTQFFLSAGTGSKTIYATFIDDSGQIISQTQTQTQLQSSISGDDRLPQLTITSPSDNFLVQSDPEWIRSTFSTPNGVYRTYYQIDGQPTQDHLESNTVYFIRSTDNLNPGFHHLRTYAYDNAGIKFGDSLHFYIDQIPENNQAPTANAGSDITIPIYHGSTATAVLSASESSDSDGRITDYSWYQNNILIGEGEHHPISLPAGTHTFTLKVTDNWQAQSQDNVNITITGDSPPPTASPCPTDINQDGITDISDFSILSQNFLSTSPSSPRSDINQDGIVDISDFSLLSVAFLTLCD